MRAGGWKPKPGDAVLWGEQQARVLEVLRRAVVIRDNFGFMRRVKRSEIRPDSNRRN